MSTRQAIAAVTAALSELVATAISGVLPMTRVTNLQPGVAVADTTTPSVNVYLYRVEPNPGLRNMADPIRNATGQLVKVPVAAWTLHYLLTMVGDPSELEVELLLGAVLTGLNAQPVLTRGLVASTDESLAQETGNRRFAAGSRLEEQAELVKLTPLALTLGELTELYSALTEGPFALSTAWAASLVLMSPTESPRPTLPVASSPRVFVSTLSSPRLTSVSDSRGESAPIVMQSTLVLRGERLRGEYTQVRIGTHDVELRTNDLSADRIELVLSPAGSDGVPRPLPLAPGVLGVQVRHRLNLSEDPAASDFRLGAASNVLAILLRPAIVGAVERTTDADGAPALGVPLAPEPDPGWEYLLSLHEFRADPPRSLVLSRWSIDAGRVLFPCAEVPAGEWLVSMLVNSAESIPDRDASGSFVGPTVTLS
jgi:hypothetical protein